MKVRVSTVQYHLHTIKSFSEFAEQVINYAEIARENKADFLLFPEFITTQLLSIKKGSKLTDLAEYTQEYLDLFQDLSVKKKLYIIGGTHIIKEEGRLYNSSYLFYPDGTINRQDKLHITPCEVKEWCISPGKDIKVFDTPKGRIAVIVCYDLEFPEVVRMVKARGADIIFCPSCTDDEHGFYRVRYSGHARAVENQVYVVIAGTIGGLPTVDFMRSNYGQSVLITPNDISFPPRGVQAEGLVNSDMVVTGDLNLELLYEVRETGSVTTWKDRRTDLYPDWK
ncbi:MAG: carbon-nitrogen hydrolase family protein [Bacillota bacterium]